MTRTELKRFIGKTVQITWRDPKADSAWTDNPLKFAAASVRTLAILVGINERAEAIIASSTDDEGEVADLNAIPLPCVEDIAELELKARRRRRR